MVPGQVLTCRLGISSESRGCLLLMLAVCLLGVLIGAAATAKGKGSCVHIGNMSWKFLEAINKAGFRHLGGNQDAGAAKPAPTDPKVRSKSGRCRASDVM